MRLIWPTGRDVPPGIPVDAVEPAHLGSLYPWPESAGSAAWLRACMVMTLDGAIAGPDGLSKSISSPADRQILSEVRRRSDALVVGASTIRAERYRPVRDRDDAVGLRLSAGQRSAPVLVVVSRTLELDWDDPLFTESSQRPIVVTVAGADASRRDAASRSCEIVVAGDLALDPLACIAELAERGLHRLTCEGGAMLLAAFCDSGAVDEMDVSVAPMVAGSAGHRHRSAGHTGAGAPGPSLQGMQLAHVLEDEGFLFTRYIREHR